uniref:Uncharacterized protein n=1 Tax=Glossina pallidipes TaxID=7398 RepID=A0A1B0A9I7_GLOPL
MYTDCMLNTFFRYNICPMATCEIVLCIGNSGRRFKVWHDIARATIMLCYMYFIIPYTPCSAAELLNLSHDNACRVIARRSELEFVIMLRLHFPFRYTEYLLICNCADISITMILALCYPMVRNLKP